MTFRATLLALTLAATPAVAELNAGAYLAARSAGVSSDYAAAAEYYTRALVGDRSNPGLLESTVNAYVGLGDVTRAVPVARRLQETGATSQVANLVMTVDAARREAWEGLIADLDAGLSVGPLFDGLVRAWALVGTGRMGEALSAFDDVADNPGVEAFGLYHKALALAYAGDFEGAELILSGEAGTEMRLTRRGVVAHATVLSQIEQNAAAVDLIEGIFGTDLDPALEDLRAALEAGETLPFTAVAAPADGVAEVLYSIGSALRGEASPAYTLLYGRLTLALSPTHIEAILLTADLLEDLQQFSLATEVYDMVPQSDPSYHAAELGRASALELAGNNEAAIEVLRQLTRTHGSIPAVHISLGDLLRRLERYDEATSYYDTAIDLMGEALPTQWVVYFARGITHEREDRWELAEADFRTALELNPDQPQVLNYLGYSFVELETNMEEALDLIERAVAARPDSGYITDSLGWALYRLGRYDEAVVHMERAVELEPVDPIINDHLGDVYWAVGREREAEFQWHRALWFEPEEEEAERIRRKLEVGLDVVLEEEGAPPLRLANDDG
ncbi:MAG: tetratricopeptide repeat protein [Paracoccaceae bacterium]|nr:tetratricopeptide repeat protein [Paracoccaceae bacterium]